MILAAIPLAALLAFALARRMRRYCRHCAGLGKVRRRGKPRPCHRCHGTGLSPRRRRRDARQQLRPLRDPIRRIGDPIAVPLRERTRTDGQP